VFARTGIREPGEPTLRNALQTRALAERIPQDLVPECAYLFGVLQRRGSLARVGRVARTSTEEGTRFLERKENRFSGGRAT